MKVFTAEIALTRAVNAEFGATAFAQRQGAAGVIAVNMREQNLGDFLNAHGFSLLDDAVHVRVGAERDVDDQSRLSLPTIY